MHNRMRLYGLLFAISIVTAGGSILFLSYIAAHAGTKVAGEYPAVTSNDASQYGQLAENIVLQHAFSQSTEAPYIPDTSRTLGYPLFVALFWALFKSFYPALIAQMIIAFLTSVLIFKIGEKIMGTRWGIAAAILYLLDPSTMLAASILLSDNLFLFFFISSLYALFFSDIKNDYTRWALAALLLALAAHVRPVALYLPLFIIPSYFLFYKNTLKISRYDAASAALFVVVFAGTLAPWYVRNHQVSGVWGFSSIGAYALFDADTPYFLAATQGISVSDAKIELRQSAGFPIDQPSPLALQKAAAMQKAALGVIAAHPVRYALYHSSAMISFFVSSSAHDFWRVYADMIPDSNIKPEPSLTQALNPFSFPLLITVINNHGWFLLENTLWALIAILAFAATWRSKNPRFARVFFVLTMYFALVTGTIAHARYRIPAAPLLIIGALSTVAYIVENKKIQRFISSR